MKKLVCSLIATACLTACGTSIEMIAAENPVSGQCSVTVYQTRGQALENGEIEEMCIINGTSSGSFRHSIANAIDMHKDRACECGATDVFVESRSDTGFSVAEVSLVAFKYRDQDSSL